MFNTGLPSLDLLNAQLDAEMFPELLAECLASPDRVGFIADFAEIDERLGQRLSLAVMFAIS
jgi:hypothetical protein|tara:strand:- start:3215 stop:3400 length:186 start_codon:yes stop_codon:yes gene_type:complete